MAVAFVAQDHQRHHLPFALVVLHLADGGGTHQGDASGEGLPP